MNGAHADQHEASMAQGAQARRARRADVDALWEWLEGTDVLRGGERFPAANRAQFEQWFAGSLKRRDQLVFALAAGEEPHALLVIRRGSLEASAFLLSRPGHTTAADVSALLDLASDELRVQAENIAARVRHVRHVHNELKLSGDSGLLSRTNDAWLTTKLKTRLFVDGDAPGMRTKVVTVNGIIYLMGLLTHEEAKSVVAQAVEVGGAQKIVKIIEYID